MGCGASTAAQPSEPEPSARSGAAASVRKQSQTASPKALKPAKSLMQTTRMNRLETMRKSMKVPHTDRAKSLHYHRQGTITTTKSPRESSNATLASKANYARSRSSKQGDERAVSTPKSRAGDAPSGVQLRPELNVVMDQHRGPETPRGGTPRSAAALEGLLRNFDDDSDDEGLSAGRYAGRGVQFKDGNDMEAERMMIMAAAARSAR
ncbi:unnamed protein product [Pedinophyceae sp. YPF-701]|nr:unnamed protein product [Pedinophyceae sp. YPF-701]